MPNSFTGIGGWNVVDSEMRSISGDFATTTALNDLAQIVANFGSYTTATPTGTDSHPNVPSPNTKTIYLVKDDSILSGDAYNEWIYTSADVSTTAWEKIGDTQVDLSDYYTIEEINSGFATTAVFNGSNAGLVPSALPADSAKALRGDGTWGDVSNVNVSYNSNDEELHLDFSIGGN